MYIQKKLCDGYGCTCTFSRENTGIAAVSGMPYVHRVNRDNY